MGLTSLRPQRASAAIAVVAAALAACQPSGSGLQQADPAATGSTRPASFQQTAELGKKWRADPADTGKGLAYASGLESLGQTDQQLAVLDQLYRSQPGDRKLAAIYGKKLAQHGRSAAAVPILEKAAAAPGADWRVHSALGSAYDQQGLFDRAQEHYAKALALKPNELSVLNNMGLSYALQGNLKQAEATFRQAIELPASSRLPRLRQNLALVVGLQGRFEEARKIAGEDLPPDEVEANMDYLQKMLAQPNTWRQLAEDGQG
jgi:Flp pilus assembly protein TadD